MTERRDYRVVGGTSRMGRSTEIIECPFCGWRTTAYIWSWDGHGQKQCANPSCGARHLHKSGQSERASPDRSGPKRTKAMSREPFFHTLNSAPGYPPNELWLSVLDNYGTIKPIAGPWKIPEEVTEAWITASPERTDGADIMDFLPAQHHHAACKEKS